MGTFDRLELSEEGQRLLGEIRKEGMVSENLFLLLDNFQRRLYRLERGEFPTEDETPTKPDRKPSQKFEAAHVKKQR